MVIQNQVQFEDMFVGAHSNDQEIKLSFDDEIDMFLGISPIPKQMEEEFSEEPTSKSVMTRKNSFKEESLSTHHYENRSEENFLEEGAQNKKSNHHNFQKHTVTALKDIVKEDLFEEFCEDSQIAGLARKLWREFLMIKGKSIMTKKFLSILFRSDIQSVPMLKIYGFQGMFSQYSQNQILLAKNQLRRIVIKCMCERGIQQHVDKRQIKRKEEFRLYLINFRQELQNANIKKRISKESSDWIQANAEVFDCLN